MSLPPVLSHPKVLRIAFTLLVFALLFGWRSASGFITPVDVTASASLDAQHGPARTLDRNILETPRDGDAWLLPDRTVGTITYRLPEGAQLDALYLLNTRNRLHFDRGTTDYHIELDGRMPAPLRAVLPFYPRWRRHGLPTQSVRRVVIHIDGFAGKGAGLLEVAFRGRTQGQTLYALSIAMLAALLAFASWPHVQRWLTTPRIVLTLCTLVTIFGSLRILYFSTGVPVFEWMLLFNVEEIDSLGKAFDFFRELRVPIPPWLAALEIGTYWITGSSELVTRTIYKISIVASYVLVLLLVYPSPWRMLLASALSLLFVAGTAAVHPTNPQIYDTIFGLITVLFLVLLRQAVRTKPTRARMAWLGAAGLTLSLWGLTRPFAVFLMPLPLGFGLYLLRPLRRAELMAFALPVVLLFGVWNAQLYARHGQVGLSNHTGINLIRCWSMVPYPAWLPERETPPYRALNNPDHLRNSQRVTHEVVQYIVGHPGEALQHVAERTRLLLSVHTNFVGRHDPAEPVVAYYKIVVQLCMALVILAVLSRAIVLARQLVRGDATLQLRDLVLTMTLAIMMIIVVGEAGEEGRFVVSLLPLLALAASTSRLRQESESIQPVSAASSASTRSS